MKTTLFIISLLISQVSFAAVNSAGEKDVSIGFNEVFVPGGFDADSDVYVVASGIFPNSCYRWKEASVAQDKEANVYEVHASAKVSQGMCLQMLIPFQKEISLGKLGRGEHKVRFFSGDGTYFEKTIVIE